MTMNERAKILAENTAAVLDDMRTAALRSGRSEHDVTLVAVSKRHAVEDIASLAAAGQKHFGENYVQEALAKKDELAHLDIIWHYIGGLQTKKARQVAGKFALLHSIDSLKLAEGINKRCAADATTQEILVQVNISGEESKSGVKVQELDALMEKVLQLDHINVQGLMTMPWFPDDPEEVRPVFAKLRELRDTTEQTFHVKLPELSMGMTGDFIVAVEEGATLVRVGTKIFGERPVR